MCSPMPKLLIGLLALLFVCTHESRAAGVEECEALYAEVQELPRLADADEAVIREGLELIREARECAAEDEPQRLAELYLDETYALYELGRFAEALAATDSLLARYDVASDSTVAAQTYQWRGFVHYHAGDLAQAVSNYSSVLAYISDEEPGERARRHRDIASIYQRMGDRERAREHLEEGITVVEAADSASADIQGARARILIQQSDLILQESPGEDRTDAPAYAEAADLAREGLRIWEELDDELEQGNALIELAEALSLGGEVDESLQYLAEAERIFGALDETARLANALWKRGQIFLRDGSFEEAEPLLQEALQSAREANHLDYERRVLLDLGVLFELKEDWLEAEEHYRMASGVTEAYRAPLRATEWSPRAFEAWQASYRGLVKALLAQERYEEAFAAFEQTRARHLDDLRQQHHLAAHLDDSDRARFDSLTAALVETRSALAEADTNGALRREVSNLEVERRELLNIESEPPEVEIEALQEALVGRGEVLVSYFIGESSRILDLEGGSYVFVITEDSVLAESLAVDRSRLRELVAAVSPMLGEEAAPSPGFDDQQFALEALHELYAHLVAPIQEHLPEGAPVAVVPDGPLYGVPFGMLVEEEFARFGYKDAPFLLKRHPISVQLTARTLLEDEKEPPGELFDLLAVGQSRYQEWQTPPSLSTIIREDTLVDLPAVPDEVSGIARLFRHARTLLDSDATKSRLLEEAREARVLHIASHTTFSTLSPFYNALLVGAGEHGANSEEDVVFLHELQQWEVSSELVVLSGCDTGRGMMMGGDGMASLQYAFHSLGVPSSVATLWLVDDTAMADLMQRFYRYLREGLHKDEALQHAQLDFLDEAEGLQASPFFWAAPVVYGTTSPLEMAPRPFYQTKWFLTLVGLLLLVLSAGGVVWQRRMR